MAAVKGMNAMNKGGWILVSIILVLNSACWSFVADEEQQARLQERLGKCEAAYRNNEPNLSESERNICKLRLNLLRTKLDGRDDREVLRAYRDFQTLLMEDETTENIMFRLFHIERVFGGTCMGKSQLCRDSQQLTYEEKMEEFIRQYDISSDIRICQMLVGLLAKNDSYEEAIEFCKRQIFHIRRGRRPGELRLYQAELLKSRLLYQRHIFERAMEKEGLNTDDIINGGQVPKELDLSQWYIVEKEMSEYLIEDPGFMRLFLSLSSSNNPYLGPVANISQIKEFHDYILKSTKDNSNLQESNHSLQSQLPKQDLELTAMPKAREQAVGFKAGLLLGVVVGGIGVAIATGAALVVLLRKRPRAK